VLYRVNYSIATICVLYRVNYSIATICVVYPRAITF
jgi:hypothetical protein